MLGDLGLSKDVVIIYGDIHLSSKDYGAHKDYAKESLEYFTKLTELAENLGATYIIGAGDLTFSKFHNLEYRKAVEKLLERQYKLTNGNRYEVKGNHDTATNGMTEYEFYEQKGLIKHVERLDVQNVHFTLCDYGKIETIGINAVDSQNDINVLVAHEYLKFKDTKLPNFGTATEIDTMQKLYDIDYIVCGHIHKTMGFKGNIIKNNRAKEVFVYYPGCMSRPSYSDTLETVGSVVVMTIEDGRLIYDKSDIPLWKIEDSFVMDEIQDREEKKTEKENRVDISDVVRQLDERDNDFGNPEDRIMGMQGIDERYKLKAIQLLKEA